MDFVLFILIFLGFHLLGSVLFGIVLRTYDYMYGGNGPKFFYGLPFYLLCLGSWYLMTPFIIITTICTIHDEVIRLFKKSDYKMRYL